ncbi:hypothetical protein AVEN_95214-1 [Araneus ventricosus]|uniref:Uncharacterized protein n=1 Tax=Araneus ventricosus TaxID=182803 RepID=A0A4Y2B8G2_ARAVE|nr:hypothetical protein AVEN_95214-1 [Araneus ventricosus]
MFLFEPKCVMSHFLLPPPSPLSEFHELPPPSKRDIIYGRPPSGFGSEVSRFESRFHQMLPVVGLSDYKSDVKRLPAGVVRKLGEEVPAQVSVSSSD